MDVVLDFLYTSEQNYLGSFLYLVEVFFPRAFTDFRLLLFFSAS